MAAQTLAAIASAPSPQAAPPAPNEDARAGEPFAALVNEASEGSGGSGKSSEKSSEKPSDALGAAISSGQEQPAHDPTEIDLLLLDQVAAALVAPAPTIPPAWLIDPATEPALGLGTDTEPSGTQAASAGGSTLDKALLPAQAPQATTLGSVVPTLAAVTSDLAVTASPPLNTMSAQGELPTATSQSPTVGSELPAPVGEALLTGPQRASGPGSTAAQTVPSDSSPVTGNEATDVGHMERTMVGLLHPVLKSAQPSALGASPEKPAPAADLGQPSTPAGGVEDPAIAVAATASQPRSEGDQPRQQPAPTDAPPSSGLRHDPLATPAPAQGSTPESLPVGTVTRPTDPAPAVAAPLPTPPAQPNPMEKAVVQQIGRALVKIDAQGERHIVLRLTPTELGTVRIELRERDGQITAHLRAEDPAVGRSIERLLPQLRQDLRSGDSHLADVVVERHPRSVAENEAARDRQPNDGRGWGSGQEQGQSQRESRNRRDPDSPLFSLEDDTLALASEPIPIARPRVVRSTGLDAVA